MKELDMNMNALLDEVKQAQREALRHANLLPKVKEGVQAATIRRPFRFRFPALWVTAAAGMAVAAYVWLQPAPLSLAIGEAQNPAAAGAVVDAPAAAPVPVHFSDGTAITVAPRARLAVETVDTHGATLVLERGSLDVSVIHRHGARWRVRAGGFEVAVTGTRFQVSFEPESEALTVKMEAGSVLVRGPGLAEATPLRAGETRRFAKAGGARAERAGAPAAAVAAIAPTIEPIAAPTPAPAEEPAAPQAARSVEPAPAAAPAMRSAVPRLARIDHTPDRNWSELAAASRYQQALSAAEHTGFAALCRQLDGGDLVLLGDVARLAGSPARAEEAYLAARRRFPNLDRPVFAMGLVAFEHRRRFHEAATWFAHYLEAYPRGPLAREAAGRLIESWQRAGETAEAERAARAYLQKYPSGPHAALARQIAGP